MQFCRATKNEMMNENSLTAQSTFSATMSSGLEGLQRYRIEAMQNEIEALKAELKKYQNVRFTIYIIYIVF